MDDWPVDPDVMRSMAGADIVTRSCYTPSNDARRAKWAAAYYGAGLHRGHSLEAGGIGPNRWSANAHIADEFEALKH